MNVRRARSIRLNILNSPLHDRRFGGRLRTDIHSTKRRVEEHADSHHDVDGAHADDGRDQARLLHRQTHDHGSDREGRLCDSGDHAENAPNRCGGVFSCVTVAKIGLTGPNASPAATAATMATTSGGDSASVP